MGSIRKCLSAVATLSKSLPTGSHASRILSSVLLRRSYASAVSGAYDGDGKTHATVLNDTNQGIMINAYSELGFALNNGLRVLGPIAIFPNCVLSWNIGDISGINEISLSLFFLLEPKLDILVLGVPDFNKTNKAAVNSLVLLVRKYNIQVEVMSTEIACPTFNFLHAEGRFVGAGIIPPTEVTTNDGMAMTGANTYGAVLSKEYV